MESRKRLRTWANLGFFAITELLGGFMYSLLAPFYSKEAAAKGVSITVTGVVYGATFLTTIIFSPIFAKYIETIGSKNLFLYGSFLAGSTTILFGFLEWVISPIYFVTLSLLIRIVCSIGEAACISSIYPLAAQSAEESMRSTVLSAMETMAGLGMMLGPVIGGVLYEVDGFYLPFIVCGGILVICTFLSALFLDLPISGSSETRDAKPALTFSRLIRLPTILTSSFVIWVTSISVCWYLPTLQPFLEKEYNISPIAAGAMFMVDGGTYALFSPIWGWCLDRGLKPVKVLIIGSCLIIMGYFMMGPLMSQNIYIIALGLFIHGIGTAANFITTLIYMMRKCVEGGAPDTEQTRAMIASLWFSNECFGGYLGSSFGGLAYDTYGFRNSTYIMIALQIIALGIIILTSNCCYISGSPEERLRLLDLHNNNTHHQSLSVTA